MGVSTDAMIVYGYHLGGGDGEFEIHEVDKYGAISVPWWAEADKEDEDAVDFFEAAMERLLADAEFTETDWHAEGYFDRKREAERRVGVKFESHCSGEYPMWILAAKVHKARRSDVMVIDPAALVLDPVDGGWDAKLQHALDVLGITPKQERAQWLLCSYWG